MDMYIIYILFIKCIWDFPSDGYFPFELVVQITHDYALTERTKCWLGEGIEGESMRLSLFELHVRIICFDL